MENGIYIMQTGKVWNNNVPWRNHTQRAVSFICECMDRQPAGAVSFITAASEKQYPLYWECTGGSVFSGETSLQGAIREVKEELGILLTPGSEKLIYQTRREMCRILRCLAVS